VVLTHWLHHANYYPGEFTLDFGPLELTFLNLILFNNNEPNHNVGSYIVTSELLAIYIVLLVLDTYS
jgi:hypothetical protein